jgi:hypothetical protein
MAKDFEVKISVGTNEDVTSEKIQELFDAFCKSNTLFDSWGTKVAIEQQ